MDELQKKNEKLIEENSKVTRKLSRLSGIEEKFMSMNSEKKTFEEVNMKMKEQARENKQKTLEIDSLNNSLRLLKNNLTKMQEQLRGEKTKVNKMVLENATLSNKLKSKERETSELNIQVSNMKIERDDFQEKWESMNQSLRLKGYLGSEMRQDGGLSEDLADHVAKLEQELELLKEQQVRHADMDEIDMDKNNELLENENKELIEKMTAMMEENHRVKEENDAMKKNTNELKEEIGSINSKLEQNEKILRRTMQSDEKKKDLENEVTKLKKDKEIRAHIHEEELQVLYSIAQEANLTSRVRTLGILKNKFQKNEESLFSSTGLYDRAFNKRGGVEI